MGMTTTAPPVGALSVPCPYCRARAGRPCSTRRGWLTTVHHQRRAAWLAGERRYG